VSCSYPLSLFALHSDITLLHLEHSRVDNREPSTNLIIQSGRQHRRHSHRRHVIRFHRRPQEEPAAKLRAALEQHSRRARRQIRPEATIELQPPAGHRYPLRKSSSQITYVRRNELAVSDNFYAGHVNFEPKSETYFRTRR
jgi:hypothetical protein